MRYEVSNSLVSNVPRLVSVVLSKGRKELKNAGNCSCNSRPVIRERCAPSAVDYAKTDADELQKDANDGVSH